MANPSTITSEGYTYMVFTSSTSINLNSRSVEYLIIGGGGGGGNNHGGGGGAGAVVNGTYNVTSNSYSVTVGNGGTQTTNGSDSSIFGFTALGGGVGGGANSVNARTGG
jgi:hypothetical protein